jgi:quercetin dioxygenase-like cupin family protein
MSAHAVDTVSRQANPIVVTASNGAQRDAYWWQGSLMQIKARAQDTGGALGLVDCSFYEGFGPPVHVHSREDEAFYVLEGQIRYRRGDDDFLAGPGTWVWLPRRVPHAFKVKSERARALILATPGGLEQMFADGGVPVSESPKPPQQSYDPEAAIAISKSYGFEVIGPQLD